MFKSLKNPLLSPTNCHFPCRYPLRKAKIPYRKEFPLRVAALGKGLKRIIFKALDLFERKDFHLNSFSSNSPSLATH